MKKLIASGILLLFSLILLVPVTGCTKTDTTEQTAVSETNQWLELMSIVPENESTLNAAYMETFGYAELLKKYYPDAPVFPGMSEDVSYSLHAFNNLPLFRQTQYSDDEWKETVGFTVGDVRQGIMATDNPVKQYQAVIGTFTAGDIENAAKTGPLQEFLEIKSYGGYEYYSWGEDLGVNMAWRSNIRRLGRGYRLADIDGFGLWEVWDGGVEEMIDAYKGNIPSLADNENYKALADELAKMQTVTAFFSARSISIGEFRELFKSNIEEIGQTQPSQLQDFNNEKLLKPFLAVATGAGMDSNGSYLVILLLNEDETTAKANTDLLKWRLNESMMMPFTPDPEAAQMKWTDNDAIQSMEIDSFGKFTRAKIYGTVFHRWDSFNQFGFGGLYLALLLHE